MPIPTAPIELPWADQGERPGRHAAPDELALQPTRPDEPPAGVGGPVAVKIRIARDRRQWQRLRHTPAWQDEQGRARLRALAENIRAADRALDALVEAGQTRRWGPADFEPGDRVRCLSAWYEVLAVGPLGLTVRGPRPSDGSAEPTSAEYSTEYAKVTGRLRHGVEDVDGVGARGATGATNDLDGVEDLDGVGDAAA